MRAASESITPADEWAPIRRVWVPSPRQALRIVLGTAAIGAAAGMWMGFVRADHAGEDLFHTPLTWAAAAGGLGLVLGLCIVIVPFIESHTRR